MSNRDEDELWLPEPTDHERDWWAESASGGDCWALAPRLDVGTRRGGRVLTSTGHWVET